MVSDKDSLKLGIRNHVFSLHSVLNLLWSYHEESALSSLSSHSIIHNSATLLYVCIYTAITYLTICLPHKGEDFVIFFFITSAPSIMVGT